MRRSILVAAVVLATVAGACTGARRAGDVADGPGGSDAIEIVMDDGRFEPESLSLPAGERVTLEIENRDETEHDFTIGGLSLGTGRMSRGDVVTASFVVPAERISFRCSLHPGMDGEIVPA